MIVDAVEDVGEPGPWIEAVHLGGFDERHRSGQRLATAIGACKEPVLPPDADRAHDALDRVVIGHAVRGVPISTLGFPSIVLDFGIGTGALVTHIGPDSTLSEKGGSFRRGIEA